MSIRLYDTARRVKRIKILCLFCYLLFRSGTNGNEYLNIQIAFNLENCCICLMFQSQPFNFSLTDLLNSQCVRKYSHYVLLEKRVLYIQLNHMRKITRRCTHGYTNWRYMVWQT